jgi:xanthine dehydrogenase accessory factor
MRAWLNPAAKSLERGEAAMLVHVVELKGSGPREPGAQMLVTDNSIAGTIGGGELERNAMLKARELLHSGRAGVERFVLGPELNQCCGGSVTLAFEPFAPADLAWLKKLMRTAEEPAALFRTLHIDTAGTLRRDWQSGDEDGDDFAAALTSPSRGRLDEQATPVKPNLAVDIRERVNPPAQALWLFGAGHVGRALVRALHPLGFAITWIDGRAGQFPEPPLPGVKQLALAMPELVVDEAPPGSVFLVMTHSHPLDEAICEAVLRRDDFAYLGLIGSDTKRARFVKRLGEAGIPAQSLKRLTCPIGLPGIRSKEPAAIAASVAADLLIRREENRLAVRDAALNGR